MDLDTITVDDFKTKFYRDFTYANQVPDQAVPPPDLDIIQNIDITNAFADAKMNINQSLLASDADITNAYLLLSAHYLCVNIRNSTGGINGGGVFPVNSRSVGSVSESYMIPDAYKDNPAFAAFLQTGYGAKYLAFMLPYLVGNVVGVYGGTHA